MQKVCNLSAKVCKTETPSAENVCVSETPYGSNICMSETTCGSKVCMSETTCEVKGCVSALFTSALVRYSLPVLTAGFLISKRLFCYRSIFNVITDTALITKRYNLCSPIVEELLVLRISCDFGIIVHPTENNPVDKHNLLKQF